MTKGRLYVPPNEREGIWFRHRGADNSHASMDRREATSTGRMLSAPLSGDVRPAPPPEPFKAKSQIMYHYSNPFSTHDNRNTIQDKGEYFGDGRVTRTLGRRLDSHHMHSTGPDFLTHHSRNPVLYNYHTETASSYTGYPPTDPASRRRFPRMRGEPVSGPGIPLDTATTDWFRDVTGEAQKAAQASTRTLAISQQPYPGHNSWKYSYKGLPTLYPPNIPPPIKQVPLTVDNVFNRYGAAFKTASGGNQAVDVVK